MPTVDDLMISLTIKENSKLGKLQKTLEEFKDGKITSKGFDSGLKVAIQKIRNKLRSLIGNRIATRTQPNLMVTQATALRRDIKKNMRDLAEKLIPVKGVETMKEEFGVDTREELVDAMEGKLDEWSKRLEMIIGKDWVSSSASGFMAAIRDFVSRGDMDDDLRKVFLTRIEKKIGEFNKEIADLLRSVGITAMSEFKGYFVKEQFKEKVARPRGAEWISKDMINKMIGIESSSEFLKQLTGLRKTTKDLYDYMGKASQILGLELKPEMFTKKGAIKTEELRAIASEMFYLWETKFKGEGAVPQGFHAVFRDMLEKNFPYLKGKHIYSKRIPDIAILQGDFEKLKTVFGEDMAKILSENQISFMELKQVLSEKNVGQIKEYEDLFGNITAVASVIKKSFSDRLPDISTKQMNILNKLTEIGAFKVFTDEEVKALQKLAEKELTPEKITSTLEKVMKTSNKMLATKEDVDKVINSLKDMTMKLERKKEKIEKTDDNW